MSKEIKDRLNRGEAVTTKTEDGEHGLAFEYCRKLALEINGALYIEESNIGFGTTIVLELNLTN